MKNMKWEDPIVAEVRKTRERLQKEAGWFDADFRKLQYKISVGHVQSFLVTIVRLHY